MNETLTPFDTAADARRLLAHFRITADDGELIVASPIDGCPIGRVEPQGDAAIDAAVGTARAAQRQWRRVPAPRRGELLRLFAESLRAHKQPLGELVTLECGKLRSEGLGEVQEMIDICDFAVGLSRQLHGLQIVSERPLHRMAESWHPLGVVGVISAFNFPVAVWAWNAALALVCGNAVVWKPSEKTPLTALACMAVLREALERFGAEAPDGLCQVVTGERAAGEALVAHPGVAMVSATGSTAMGRAVGPRLAQRFARPLLELGGNNAVIVCPSADPELALRAIAFGAMGTAGQRCTSTRRLLLHRSHWADWVPRLVSVFGQAAVGDPRDPGTLVGPLIDRPAFEAMQTALDQARDAGGVVHGGERLLQDRAGEAFYARPAIVEMPAQCEPMTRETFAPILYAVAFDELDEAIALNNGVAAGLSSAIFTRDLREAERFVSSEGSDCGIANVNIGTSGAEIGGAFGGEKETGGGRESGSDCWKGYMRRATNTVNYGDELPLAQGVRFDL